MNTKKIIKQFMGVGAGTIISMLLGLFSTPIITRIVPTSEYGEFSIFNTYALLFFSFLCLGQDQAVVRYFYDKEDIKYKRALLFKAIILPILLSAVTTVLVFFLVIFIKGSEANKIKILALGGYVIILLLQRFGHLTSRLNFKTSLYSFIIVVQKLIYLSIALFLIYRCKKEYLTILIFATMMSYLGSFIVSVIGQHNLWSFNCIKKKECVISQKELFLYGFPFVFSTAIDTLFSSFDRISIEHWCDYSNVGIYASAGSLIAIFSVIQTTFCSIWTPLAVENYSKGNNDFRFYNKWFRYISFIMFFVAINIICFKDVIVLFLGEKYRSAAQIIPFLVFQPLMYTISETTGCGIYLAKKSIYQVWFISLSCISNIIGNIVLVPVLGAKGAAISTGISYIVFFIFRTLFSQKVFCVQYELKSFYFLTSMMVIYAIINTFYEFTFGNIITYIVCMLIWIVSYLHEIKQMINVIKIKCVR